jgi:hypothetical protein
MRRIVAACAIAGLLLGSAHGSPLREDVEGMKPIDEVIAQGGGPNSRPVVMPPPSAARDCRFYRQAFKPSFQNGGSAAYDMNTYRLCQGYE